MIEDIISLCKTYMIDFLDIKTIQTIALKTKRYDLLVYLNNNSIEYISYVKNALYRNNWSEPKAMDTK